MKGNFPTCCDITLKHEGGFVNHPSDPGGRTMRGVTQRTYDSWRSRKGLKVRDVKLISDSELKQIYARDYWHPVGGEILPAGVDLATYDFGVNSGPSRAVKYLQRVVGARVDGRVGAETFGKVIKLEPVKVVRALCKARLSFVQGLRTWGVFGKGWARRIGDILARAVYMATNSKDEVIKDIKDIEDSSKKDQNTSGQTGTGGGGGIGVGIAIDPAFIMVGVILVAVAIFYFWRSRVKKQAAMGMRNAFSTLGD